MPLSVRMRIHTDPLVAGVIGRRNFIYDLWGDTDAFEPRGEIEVSGKGRMRTYLSMGRNGTAA